MRGKGRESQRERTEEESRAVGMSRRPNCRKLVSAKHLGNAGT